MKFKEFLPLVIGQSIKLHQCFSRYKVKFSFNLERRLFWLPVTVSYTEGLGFIWAACEAQVFGYRTWKQTEAIIWRPVICTEVSVCSESNYSCARQNIAMATLLAVPEEVHCLTRFKHKSNIHASESAHILRWSEGETMYISIKNFEDVSKNYLYVLK